MKLKKTYILRIRFILMISLFAVTAFASEKPNINAHRFEARGKPIGFTNDVSTSSHGNQPLIKLPRNLHLSAVR